MSATYSNRHRLLEKYVEVVREDGLNTNKNVNIGINGATANLWVSGAITSGSGLGNSYTQTLTPVSVAADTTAEQTFTVAGLVTGQGVVVNGPTPTPGTGIVNARVSAANTLALTFCNVTASGVVPASGSYLITQL
jgi:hypothetical protein